LEAIRLSSDQSAVPAEVWADPAIGPDRGGGGQIGWNRAVARMEIRPSEAEADLDVVVGEAFERSATKSKQLILNCLQALKILRRLLALSV
jgi:hypothetical protein